MLEIAEKISAHSTAPNFKLGCVIAKGWKVLGLGFNDITVTHPRSETMGRHIHAELAAILDAEKKSDLKGATAYVYRGMRRPLIAKPCGFCRRLFLRVGIRKVIYSIEGNFEVESYYQE